MPTAQELIAGLDAMNAQAGAMTPEQRRARAAELAAQMQADQAAHDRAMHESYSYRTAFAPESAPAAPVQAAAAPAAMLPPPQAAAPPSGAPAANEGQSVLGYVGETLRNVPADAARVGEGIWQGVQAAADDPLGALRGLGESALGTMQQAAVDPRRTVDPRFDFRDAGPADHYGAYDLHNIGETFRTRPVQTALDLGGLAAVMPGAGTIARAGARAAGAALNPARKVSMEEAATAPRGPTMTPEDVRVATDAGDAVRETVDKMKGAAAEAVKRERGTRAFIEGAPTTEALGRQADVFFEAARKSGVRFSSTEFGPFRKKLVRKLREEGADKVLHPKVARLIGLIENARPAPARA